MNLGTRWDGEYMCVRLKVCGDYDSNSRSRHVVSLRGKTFIATRGDSEDGSWGRNGTSVVLVALNVTSVIFPHSAFIENNGSI